MTERSGWVVETPASYSGRPELKSGSETGYPDWGFLCFPQSLQASAGIVP
jgi:hypothetical protein